VYSMKASLHDITAQLALACYEGDLIRVSALVAMGADPAGKTPGNDWSMLRHACNAPNVQVQSSTPVVRFFLEQGVDLEGDVDGAGTRPVDDALNRCQWDSVRCLVEAGSPLPGQAGLDRLRQGGSHVAPPSNFLEEIQAIAEHRRLALTLAEASVPASHRPHRL
jgi:hypothetical protein